MSSFSPHGAAPAAPSCVSPSPATTPHSPAYERPQPAGHPSLRDKRTGAGWAIERCCRKPAVRPAPAPFPAKLRGGIARMTGPTRRGRPSLGERAVMTATLPGAVLNAATAATADYGIDRSAVLTDIVCFPLRPTRSDASPPAAALIRIAARRGRYRRCNRPPRESASAATHRAARRARPSATRNAAVHLADIICRHMGFPHLVRELDTKPEKEVLPLAI